MFRLQRFFSPLILLIRNGIATAFGKKETQPATSGTPSPPPSKPVKIALVLGAGAAKGFAHIGVLKVLEANQVPIHMVVGTSVGSLVGSLYAYGYNPLQLQAITLTLEKSDLFDLVLPDNGFVKGEKLADFVNQKVKNTPLEELEIPFYAVATDIENGREFVFGEGDTGTAVRASCSIPGVFRPVRIGERMFVDGGLVSPVAVDAAKKYGGEVIIAVDVSSGVSGPKPESTIKTLLQSIDIMHAQLSAIQCAQADIVIKPQVDDIGSSDFTKRNEAILKGEKATMEALPNLRSILDRYQKEGRLKLPGKDLLSSP
jgi:NTE family protein